MRAVRIEDARPALVDMDQPAGEGVLVKVATASICGSDLHMIDQGWAEGGVLGHEVCGTTPDGTAVAIEPFFGCGGCHFCDDGYRSLCTQGADFLGGGLQGGMAEYLRVPDYALVPLPTGLSLEHASLVEPMAVAFHVLNQVNVTASERVLVVGAGAIGLATAAALKSRGITCDIAARHDAQKAIAQSLGANPDITDGYDVTIDAVGSSESVALAMEKTRPRGRIGMVGCFWEPAKVGIEFCTKELTLIASFTYKCQRPGRTFEEAATALCDNPEIARQMITHRFPLEAASDAFATARDRQSGGVKVVFDIA